MRNQESIIPLSLAARAVWAKTGGGEMSHLWSPLYVHMGDSAQIARLLWREWLPESEKRFVVNALGGNEAAAEALVVWLAAVHDIGKATPAFQCKVQARAEVVSQTGLVLPDPRMVYNPSHAFMGQVIIESWLGERGWKHLRTFSCIVGGHHGITPNGGDLRKIQVGNGIPNEGLGDGAWESVQDELLRFAFDGSGIRECERTLQDTALPQTAQVLLTGLVIMADWLASNSDFFPLVAEVATLKEFETRAQGAWRSLALPSAWRSMLEAHNPNFDELFHRRFEGLPKDTVLHPAQRAALEAAEDLNSPGLIIIEAPMGNGKTEASLLCAEVLAQRFGCGGVSYLLPTMATSNAMFARVESWLEHVPLEIAGTKRPIQLLHSKATLNSEFVQLKTWGATGMGDGGYSSNKPSEESVIAHQWFGGRKRGLLASFVVGTVDQLLMAALKTRHVQLRHLGLAGKVVVIDEVHAYDAYMSAYLDRTLAWLGAYGVPIVLLSATLPPQRRRELIEAYRGQDASNTRRKSDDASTFPTAPRLDSGNPAYPLITSSCRDRNSHPVYRECAVETAGTDVSIEFMGDDDTTLLTLLREALADGGCVCIIRDTVKRAQETYALMREELDIETKLVHSRFIAVDRASNDAELLGLLGPNSSCRPQALVVVGTQVIEQSLDIDFDLMVSDIAPIDLLLQRMGRLHRHRRGEGQAERPSSLRKARFVIVGSDNWAESPPSFGSGVSYVYQPAILWRTVLALRQHASHEDDIAVNLPRDISGLVERVYEGKVDIPKGWEEEFDGELQKFNEQQEQAKAKAKAWLLGSPKTRRPGYDLVGWMRDSYPLHDEAQGRAAVRDTQESIEVIAVQESKGAFFVFPWVAPAIGSLGNGADIPDDEVARIAASCTVNLPPELASPWAAEGTIAALEESWPMPGWQESRWLKGQLVIAFDAQGNATLPCRNQVYRLHYARETGLELVSCEKKEG